MRVRRLALAALGALSLALELEAQAPSSKPQAPIGSLQVYLVTIGEGGQIWEKFGHNSLWFRDSASRVDEIYNWGTFDFEAPDFAWRFVTGETKYWVEKFPGGQLVVDFFIGRDRTVHLQRLNLTPAQAAKALAFARNNALEANKYYRYDYFLDNCSTRVRDLIDYATDGALKAATGTVTVPRSFRSESVRLTDDLKFAQLGITVALGRPADKPLTLWEDAFVPMRLRDMVRDVRVTIDGKQQPLVAEEAVPYTTRDRAELADVPSIWMLPLFVGVLLMIDLVTLGIIGERSRMAEVVFRTEVVIWAFLTGILGAAILFAWMFTKHTFWAANENLLLVNPLSVWLVPLAIMSARNKRWARPAAIAAVIVALCSALALVLSGVPGAGQVNGAVLALTLPVNFAIAFILWRRTGIRG